MKDLIQCKNVHLWKQTLSWAVISERGKELFCNQTVFLEDRPCSGRETPEPDLTLPGKRNNYSFLCL